MVEGAVPSELVSKLDFPVRGENTGNWSILRPTSLLSTAKDVRFSAEIRSQFPNPEKRESRGRLSGKQIRKSRQFEVSIRERTSTPEPVRDAGAVPRTASDGDRRPTGQRARPGTLWPTHSGGHSPVKGLRSWYASLAGQRAVGLQQAIFCATDHAQSALRRTSPSAARSPALPRSRASSAPPRHRPEGLAPAAQGFRRHPQAARHRF